MPGLLNAKQRPPAEGEVTSRSERPVEAGADPEQQAYTTFVKNGLRMIYDKKATEQLLTSLEGDGNPIDGLGSTLFTLFGRLTDSAAKNGVELSPDVVARGAGELMEALAELSAESGGHQYTDEEKTAVAQSLVQAIYQQGAEQGEESPTPAAAPAAPRAASPPPRRGMMA